MWWMLQPCVVRAAPLCARGCSPVWCRLAPCVVEAATLCCGGCNPVWWGLQPCVVEGAALCGGGCSPVWWWPSPSLPIPCPCSAPRSSSSPYCGQDEGLAHFYVVHGGLTTGGFDGGVLARAREYYRSHAGQISWTSKKLNKNPKAEEKQLSFKLGNKITLSVWFVHHMGLDEISTQVTEGQSSPVTLPLHCHYTAFTLLLHCCYIIVTLLLQHCQLYIACPTFPADAAHHHRLRHRDHQVPAR